MRLEYSNSNNKINVFVETPDVIINSKANEQTDFSLIFKRIVLDVLNQNKDKNLKTICIDIQSIDENSNKIFYFIRGESGKPRELSLKLEETDRQKVVDKIAKKHIIRRHQSETEVGLESILEEFSASARPIGFLGKLKNILSEFFSKIRDNFRFIDVIWEDITKKSEKRLKWDLTLLSDICGTPSTNKMTLSQALKYMKKCSNESALT